MWTNFGNFGQAGADLDRFFENEYEQKIKILTFLGSNICQGSCQQVVQHSQGRRSDLSNE